MGIREKPDHSLESYFEERSEKINQALDSVLPKTSEYPSVIHEAMRYSVMSGGKRIRPILTLAVCEMLTGNYLDAMLPACAVELIHTYSLIHDDLPCMDNDDVRRGKPACHKQFGEAIALLAGDGLLTLAFHVLGDLQNRDRSARIAKELSYAAGTFGMVGGQVVDVINEGKEIDIPTLDYIAIHKTGQLIKASCLMGAIAAGTDKNKELSVTKYGEYLGFAFQVVDDILDGDGYMRFVSTHEAQEKANELIRKAKQELEGIQNHERLFQIADYILKREK